ncbi:hypothetical protein [uncultured Maribacter sp.]|uniref:hypothetical protein n=1 Tax=uncultured Maribacter sp. TaxID=431308 RepID=UPI00260F2E01|nr:hypothetical protein [uncultured Maribacter sp.]
MKYFLGFTLCLISFLSYSQKEELNKKVSLHSWSYPLLPNGDTHSYFDLGYKIDSRLQIELRGFYDNYILANVSKFDITAKKYITNKSYAFTGLGIILEESKMGQKSPKLISNYSYGVRVDVHENLFLEARQQIQTNTNIQGVYTIPKLFTLGGI